MRITRALTTASIAAATALTLAACGGVEVAETETEPTAVETAAEEAEDAPEETEDEAPAEASGDTPDWALPAVTPGELIATLEGENFSVDVYQVGIAQATKTGQFVDPDTNTPLIEEGDDIVFVNYVVTNTSDEEIQLGSSLVNVTARYDDWPYLQGMDSIVDKDLFEAQGVHADGLAPGSYRDPSVYVLAPGQTYSTAQNFKHQAGSPITFTARLVPVDGSGDLRHDVRQEVDAAGTIS